MHVRFVTEITPEGVDGVDQANADIRAEVSHQLADGLSSGLQEHLQKRAVGVEKGPQEVVGGEGDVEVRDI